MSAVEALEKIQDDIGAFEEVGASEEEADFLQDFFDDPAVGALLEMYDNLKEDDLADPEDDNAREVVQDVLQVMKARAFNNQMVAELKDILQGPHFQGITVSLDKNNDLIIARILQGSLADKQGLLHVDDKVREVNGIEVYTPEDMMLLLKEATTSVTMKIVPSYRHMTHSEQEEQFIETVRESREIEKIYRGYFDDSIVNDDFDTTYMYVLERINSLHRGAKWIPVEWKDE
nr:hypothetical protein BaRGS_025315 [Batillaria attramentaria]